VASAVVGGALALAAQRDASLVENAAPGQPWKDLRPSYDEAASFRVVSYSTLAIGAAAAIAGAVLLGIGYHGRGAERRISALPALGAEGAALVVAGSF
jgi:hypothetical protein